MKKVYFDKKMIKICGYIILTVVLTYSAIHTLDHLPDIVHFIRDFIEKVTTILKPFLIGLCIAFFFWPAVHFIECKLEENKLLSKIVRKKSYRRALGVIAIYMIILGFILAMITGIYVMIGGQVSKNISFGSIITTIANYLMDSNLDAQFFEQQLQKLNIPLTDSIKDNLASILSTLQTFVTNSISNVFNSVINIGNNLISILVSTILSIYLLLDKEYFLDLWNKIFYVIFRESKVGLKIRYAFEVFNDTFTNYIKGQLLEAFFVGVMASIALLLLDVDYAIVIGIFAGITNMIPYVGPWIGTILGALMALLSGKFLLIIWVIIALQIVQQIDNNLLAPKIVGNKVGLHAVFTMIAILIGANLGGIFGMLVSVPIFASIKNLIASWYDSKDFEQKRLAFNESHTNKVKRDVNSTNAE